MVQEEIMDPFWSSISIFFCPKPAKSTHKSLHVTLSVHLRLRDLVHEQVSLKVSHICLISLSSGIGRGAIAMQRSTAGASFSPPSFFPPLLLVCTTFTERLTLWVLKGCSVGCFSSCSFN